jgi:hypothetical protein
MSIETGPILILSLLISLIAVGLILISIGFRGRAMWSSPYCIACRYDLRGLPPEETPTCPECGADLKHSKAIGFIQRGHQPRLIWLGLSVLVIPLVLSASLFYIIPYLSASKQATPINLSSQTNAAVISYTKAHMGSAVGWKELADRIPRGTLSKSEGEQALNELTHYMNKVRPDGWNTALGSQQTFLEEGYRAGLFSDAGLIKFADAYHCLTPELRSPSIVTSWNDEIKIQVLYGSQISLANNGGPPIELLWSIKEATFGGEPLIIKKRIHKGLSGDATLEQPVLAPGSYDLEVTLVAAYVESKMLTSVDRDNPSPANLPQTIKRWTVSTKQTLQVAGHNPKAVALSIDPSLDPQTDGMQPQYIAVESVDGRKRVIVKMMMGGLYKGALSYDVSVVLGGRRYEVGFICYEGRSTGHRRGSTWQPIVMLDALDPKINSADILLTPNPRHAMQYLDADTVWGEPSFFKDIPIKRYDLSEGAENESMY